MITQLKKMHHNKRVNLQKPNTVNNYFFFSLNLPTAVATENLLRLHCSLCCRQLLWLHRKWLFFAPLHFAPPHFFLMSYISHAIVLFSDYFHPRLFPSSPAFKLQWHVQCSNWFHRMIYKSLWVVVWHLWSNYAPLLQPAALHQCITVFTVVQRLGLCLDVVFSALIMQENIQRGEWTRRVLLPSEIVLSSTTCCLYFMQSNDIVSQECWNVLLLGEHGSPSTLTRTRISTKGNSFWHRKIMKHIE